VAYEWEGGAGPPAARAAARSFAAGDDVARHSAAVLVVAFSCAMSGLLVGLCLAGTHWMALAFVAGAALAGAGTWIARDLIALLRD